MRFQFVGLAVAALGASLVVVPAVRAETGFATKKQFVDAVAGKSLSTTTKSGKPFSVTYGSGGSGTFRLGDGKASKFTWTFKGDTLCSVFKTMKFTECNHVQITGPTKVRFIDAATGKINNDYSVN